MVYLLELPEALATTPIVDFRAPCVVIIAGGEARRLHPYSDERPKALMELTPGVTVIDFILHQLHHAGISEIIVVTRPEHRSSFEEKLGDKDRVVTVKGEGFGNLHSLVSGLNVVGRRHILLVMGDHIFEADIVRQLIKADDGNRCLLLCLDRQPDSRNLQEGLRVQTSQQYIDRVGKMIPPQSGVDVGLFIISPDIHDMVYKLDAESEGKATISDLINRLAAEGKATYVDVTGRLWVDIDTPSDLIEARRRYWEIRRRDLYKPTDGPVSRWLNRPLSTRLSIFLFKHAAWATPNRITAISFLVALVAALLFVKEQLMVGGLLAHFSSVLDGVDGELARLRDDITPFGSLLDSLLDRLSDISLIIALGFALSPTPISLALTGLAAFGAVSVSYVSQLAAKYVYVEKLRVSFPWATRDVRLFTITLGGLTLQPLLPIIFCAIAPLAFTARTLVRVKSLRRSSARTVPAPATGSRVPEPRISVTKPVKEEHIIRENLESLVVNILKLAVSLSILQLIRGPLEHMWNTKYLPAYLDARLAIDVAQLVVSVYFGYRILLSTKFFADMATDLVVTRLQITQSMYARITTDTFYLIISGLAWSVTSPIIAKLPEAVSLLGLVINLAFFAFMVLLTYDLLRTLHRGLRGHWDSMMGRLADWLGEHLRHPDRECIKR